jgi:hypothetical protein
MDRFNEDPYTHIYGVGSLTIGLIGIVFLVPKGSDWHVYALISTGWIAAIFNWYLLYKSAKQARLDGRTIGELESKIIALKKELSHRNKTLDYISRFAMGQKAIPRASNDSMGTNGDIPND